jgi:hypothetical protein
MTLPSDSAGRDDGVAMYDMNCVGCGRPSGQVAFHKPILWTCLDCAERDLRIQGALLALSRVAVWVAMEANFRSEWNPGLSRADLLVTEMFEGRLRLAYPGETHELPMRP